MDPENQRPTNCSNHDSDVRQVQQVKPTSVNEVQNFIGIIDIKCVCMNAQYLPVIVLYCIRKMFTTK